MSLFGAMTTAISGLTAQSRALGHISDNVANSQTIGFKRIDTNFVSYITDSSLVTHRPGSVIARPDFTNTMQGTVEQAENPLAMAIAGQGFFSVAQARGSSGGTVQFDERQFYTRAGDFGLDRDGYLVNGAGYYLQGWASDAATGAPDRTTVAPIQVSDLVYNPVPTGTIDMTANLPANVEVDSVGGAEASSQVQIYDSLGGTHTLTLRWDRDETLTNTWTLTLSIPTADGTLSSPLSTTTPASNALDPITVTFNDDGTINQIGTSPGTSGDPATLSFSADFGGGAQALSLNLGAFDAARGVTQYNAAEYSVRNLSQDGVPLGSFSSVSIRNNGDVAINYDNGQFRIIARVPVVTFPDADKLQRLDGQAFMRTVESGEARVSDVSSNGAGKLLVGSVERSNVDIASEFTKLIVAQRAYTANTRIVTSSDEMLQDTINMKR